MPETFVETQIKEIKNIIGNEKAVIAVSGGVDSSTCAVLTHLAIGDNLLCVILDDAFMREGEPERVSKILSQPPLNLPIRIEQVQERFLEALKGLKDAEEKRKAFRETFYRTLSNIAKREGSQFIVQGTILADILETKGGIKTQHNVLEQIGISTRELYGFRVIEPLVSLLKWQVREVARYLKIPPEISERQPFPGPGLSVRVVGKIKIDKLNSLKRATTITEEKLAKHKPSQYFAAIIDNKESRKYTIIEKIRVNVAKSLNIDPKEVSVKIFNDKATGIKDNARRYGDIIALSCREKGRLCHPPLGDLIALQKNIVDAYSSVTRVWQLISEGNKQQPYAICIRAVKTEDFLSAHVADIPWSTLEEASELILKECPNVSSVYYDVTPKPPATIEME
ncbi:MAG: ATP-binding protein [Candidatus Bathyarchaeia archaeon]